MLMSPQLKSLACKRRYFLPPKKQTLHMIAHSHLFFFRRIISTVASFFRVLHFKSSHKAMLYCTTTTWRHPTVNHSSHKYNLFSFGSQWKSALVSFSQLSFSSIDRPVCHCRISSFYNIVC